MLSMGNSPSQPDDGSEDHHEKKCTPTDHDDDGSVDAPAPEPAADTEPRKKRKKKRRDRVTSPAVAEDAAVEDTQPSQEVPAATARIEVVGEKPRRKKKGRQTSQEEESAQALLALNKGLPAAAAAEAEEDAVVDEAVASPELLDAEDARKKKKAKSHKKKKAKHSSQQSPTLDEPQHGDDEHEHGVDAQFHQSPSPGPGDGSPHQVDTDTALQNEISHQHHLEHEIPDSDRIISQHLAAHMSKHAPPPPASVPDLQDVLMDDGLHFTNGLDDEHLLDHDLLSTTPRKSKGKPTYKRKRPTDTDEANKLVDPALREFDEATAAAAAAASIDNPFDDTSDAHKTKKKRRLPTDKVVSLDTKPTPKRAPRSRKPPTSTPTPTTATPAATGGTFTLEERHAIDTHLNAYMAAHDLTHADLCTRVWSNDRKKDDFWESVCSVLPQRSRASIYKHVRRSYHVFQQRAKWTAEEDEELARQVAEKGSSWKDVGDAMGRMGEDCRDRWRNYVKCGEGRGKDRWGEEEEADLRRVLKEVLGAIKARRLTGGDDNARAEIPDVDLDQPGDISGEEDINWTSISELMGNRRSRIQCRYKWNKMKQQKARLLGGGGTPGRNNGGSAGWRKRKPRAAIEDMQAGDKLWLLTRIRNSGALEERNIDWETIAETAAIWSAKDLEKAYKTIRTSLPHRRLPLTDLLAKLISDLEALPEGEKSARYHQGAAQQQGYETLYGGGFIGHVPVSGHNPAPVAAMGMEGYGQHEIEGMAMVDPALIGQGGVGGGVGGGMQQELEKTAGEAILIAQAAVAAANAEKGRIEGVEDQVIGLEGEGETERELRRRLGV